MSDDNQQTAVDNQFLAAMGLDGLEGEEKQAALDGILYTLNIRIGERVAEQLTEEQTENFDQLSDDASPEELANWLKANAPNYQQLAEEEAKAMRKQVLGSVARAMGEEPVAQTPPADI